MKIVSKYRHLLVILFIFISACTNANTRVLPSHDVSSEEYPGFKDSRIDEVLILPVLVRAKQDGVLVNPESVLGIPDSNSTKILVNAFDAHTDFPIAELSSEKVELYISKNGVSKEGLFKIASDVAKKESKQNVLFVLVDDKDNRTGGSLGSDRASSVAYRIWLYNNNQDKVVWSSAYQSSETALTENLFEVGDKIQRGFAFKTTEQLLKDAFKASAVKLKKDVNKITR